MPRSQTIQKVKLLTSTSLVSLFAFVFGQVTVFADSPPPRCVGYGNVQVYSLTNWEAGLGSWVVGTHGVGNPPTFDTPDWAVVGGLPAGRAGMAAFVENLDASCENDDETGALNLDSPSVVIPSSSPVPRILINHFYETEFGWDGGNLRISINGGSFNLVPPAAIEYGSYNATLFPALDDEGFVNNPNPLADQLAFTGTNDGKAPGSWQQTRINLLGIASPGDSIKLRFDFGLDTCGGEVGWYVDEVEFYNCQAELPPSDCGNGVIDPGEQCDDGNDFIADGCSNTCQIDEGWQCTAPTPAGIIEDHGFETGTPNSFWTEVSNNAIGTPICETAVCGSGGGSGPSDGDFWVFLGGSLLDHEGSVSQSVVVPSTVSELSFDLEIPVCDSASDYLEVLVDGNQELLLNGIDPRCGMTGYTSESVDISAYADGGLHSLVFHSETFSNNGSVSNFFIDNIAMPLTPSICRRDGTKLTLVKEVTNDNDGTASASAWTLAASGPSGFNGPGPMVLSGNGFLPGTYNLSESGGPSGYGASAWDCDGGTQVDSDTVSIAFDEAVTCTITNDDIDPNETIFKDGFE